MKKDSQDIFDFFKPPVPEPVEAPVAKAKSKLFEHLGDICNGKKYVFSEDDKYDAFMINRFLSLDITTLLYAQEMNERPFIDDKMHFDFLFYGIKKQYRKLAWIKKSKNDEDSVNLLVKYYCCSKAKAREMLPLVSAKHLEDIAAKFDPGGVKKQQRKQKL